VVAGDYVNIAQSETEINLLKCESVSRVASQEAKFEVSGSQELPIFHPWRGLQKDIMGLSEKKETDENPNNKLTKNQVRV
jgi:hypothetical protein